MAEMSEQRLCELRVLCETYATQRGYKLVKELGSGGSAAVFQVQTGSSDIAVKVHIPAFFQGAGGAAERRRVELQRELIGHSCPSLVQMLRIEYELDTCFIEMEFHPWQDLSKCLLQIPRTSIYPLLGQLVAAVRYLEDSGLVHRDIKPANILVGPNFDCLVLIDLGVVRESSTDEDRLDGTDHGAFKPFIATNQYSSPEYLFRTLTPSPELWKALTIYQIGGVLHDFIVREPLFDAEVKTGNRYAVALAVQQKMPNLDVIQDVAPELKGLALRCLTKEPSKRIRFVTWDDFSPPSTDITSLQKRLAVLAHTQTRQHAIQQGVLKNQLGRRDYSTQLFEAVASLVKEKFHEVVLEQVQITDCASRYVLRWHFHPLSSVMDLSIEIEWPADVDNSGVQPDISLHGLLTHGTSKLLFKKGLQMAVASSSGQNIQTSAYGIFEVASRYLSSALTLLEQGEQDQEVELGA